MNRKLLRIFVIAAGLLVASIPAIAHHGVAGYDLTKTITVHGTVTKFDWSNPHCVIHMDAKNASGEVQNWTIELAAPSLLSRMGWTKNAMKAGDEIGRSSSRSKRRTCWDFGDDYVSTQNRNQRPGTPHAIRSKRASSGRC